MALVIFKGSKSPTLSIKENPRNCTYCLALPSGIANEKIEQEGPHMGCSMTSLEMKVSFCPQF